MKNMLFSMILLLSGQCLLDGQGLVSQDQDSNGAFALFGKPPTIGILNRYLAIGENSIEVNAFPTSNDRLLLNPVGGKAAVGTFSTGGKLSILHNASSSSPSLVLTTSESSNTSAAIAFRNVNELNSFDVWADAIFPGLQIVFRNPTANTIAPMITYRPDLDLLFLNNVSGDKITYTGELRVSVLNGGQTFNMLNELRLENDSPLGTNQYWSLGAGGNLSIVYNGVWIGGIDSNGEYFNFSDARYKKDILPLERGLSDLAKFSSYRYSLTKGTRALTLGFLAQEVQQIIPEAVQYDAEQNVHMVCYKDISVLTVAAIQERQREIEALHVAVTQTEAELALLEQLLNQLKE